MITKIRGGRIQLRSIKIMLLGIALMLIAIYIPHEDAFRTGGSEIFLLALGFVLVIIGLLVRDKG